jgi:threonine/homoserine/homoserine lactone efflux protein
MEMSRLVAFTALSFVVAVTPGPDSLLVLRHTLQRGRREGVRVGTGAASGSLAWGVCSALGVTALLAASARTYRAVELAGAAYLVVLGVQGWRTKRPAAAADRRTTTRRRRSVTGFRAGLLSSALNPKLGLFFLAVMPQFIPQRAPTIGYALAYAAIDSLVAVAWLAALAWIGDKAGAWSRRPGVKRTLDRVAGAMLIGIGLKVAVAKAPT